jgi:hypothetical protein
VHDWNGVIQVSSAARPVDGGASKNENAADIPPTSHQILKALTLVRGQRHAITYIHGDL